MTDETALAPDWQCNARELAQRRIAADWQLADSLAQAKRDGNLSPGQTKALSLKLGISAARTKEAIRAATRFPPHLRVSALSFEHHAALSTLADEQALPALELALQEQLPVRAMREVVAQHRYAIGERWDDEDVTSTLCTQVLRAWNRATPEARQMAFDLIEIAAANGFGIIDEDEPDNG